MRIISIYAILLTLIIPALAFANLAQNPSMEGAFIDQEYMMWGVAEYWTGWISGQAGVQIYEGTYAHDGFKSQQISWFSEGYESFGPDGIYQQIGSLDAGQIYKVSVWFKFDFRRQGTYGYCSVTCRVAIDPNGGTDPDAVTNWMSGSDSSGGDDYGGPWIETPVLFFSPTGTSATLFVELTGHGDAEFEEIDPWGIPIMLIPAPWAAECYIDDVVVESVDVNAATSTVEATSPVPANGFHHSDVTITVLDAIGNPIEGIPASEIDVNCTGSGNIISGPDNPTDANGQTTAKIASTVAEIKIVSATVLGRELSDTATVEFIPYWLLLTVQTSPNDVNTVTPPVGEHSYARGTIVDIRADRFIDCPYVDVFDYWEGDVNDVNSPETTILMDDDKTVTAVFVDGRVCGDECHPYPPGDANRDCVFDFRDIAEIAPHWLKCTKPECD